MHLEAIRLQSGKDLKKAITAFVADRHIAAGVIVSAVGSLAKAQMRMAGAQPDNQDVRKFDGPLEIISLIGTVSSQGEHLHIAISDSDGKVYGGHLKEGGIIDTTVELVIAVDDRIEFTRELDPITGFKELTITETS